MKAIKTKREREIEKKNFSWDILLHSHWKPSNVFLMGTSSCQFLPPVALIIKLVTAVIYSFRIKLECLSLNTRLGWKGLAGTNTLAYYENCKLRP